MIDTIIFDFAGVITNEGFLKALVSGLKKHFNFDESLLKQRFLANENVYMSGGMSGEDFWKIICFGFNIPFSEYKEIYSTAFELNQNVVGLIKKLKPNYQIVLFSDNFDILSEKLRNDAEFINLFHEVIFSNEIGLIKQAPGSFEYVLEKIHKQGSKCVFIDDKANNLVPAERLGITGLQFKNYKKLETDLIALGVRI
jgi:HAD superfamily hydrolase (TIGR01509 family)